MTTAVRTDLGQLRGDVRIAARVLAPNWPLGRFIAVNPLGGFEDRPFPEAVAEAAGWFGSAGTPSESIMRAAFREGRIERHELVSALRDHCPGLLAGPPLAVGGELLSPERLLVEDLLGGEPAPAPVRTRLTLAEATMPDAAELIDSQCGKWMAAFLDRGQARWAMPGRERGFYAAWRALAVHDPALPRAARALLGRLPERADAALADALDRLGIPAGHRREYLRRHLTALPGWAAHVRWHAEHGQGLDLVDYLAMRVSYESALLDGGDSGAVDALWEPATGPDLVPGAERALQAFAGLPHLDPTEAELAAAAALLNRFPASDRPLIWLDAYERHYRDRLLATLATHRAGPPATRPAAQLVCCIDARSEGLRRHLEAAGPYETLGFAGFFAVAIRFQALATTVARDLCPVLLEPRNAVTEQALDEQALERFVRERRDLAAAGEAFHSAKDDAAAPFATAEVSGWLSGPVAAARTAAPGSFRRARSALARRLSRVPETAVTADAGFALDERRLLAEVALTMMGLTSGFGRLVVLCGHGSTTENNPYAAALDCGACGGHRGGPNARTMAAILNDPDVRVSLAARGIEIPADTWFCAAEHDTATDEVTVLDTHLVPETHHDELGRLREDLASAGSALSTERAADLPGAEAAGRDASRHTAARSGDWAQVFPEWGLAGNAAFIVGPRAMTAGLDLGRRTFLHSYDAAVDREGEALETILTAPLVVAQWINCQYYFSTVDPVVHGAGTKTIHNVVAGVGVLAGQSGDLQLGLPWQSVADGKRLVHEPMRLAAIVEAPLDRIAAIIERNEVLQRLFGGGWVALVSREGPGAPWMQYRDGAFQPWSPSGHDDEEEEAA